MVPVLLGRRGGGRSAPFSPLALAGVRGVFGPAQGNTWTLNAGGSVCTAGQAIGRWENEADPLNPLVQLTAENRATLGVSGGNSWSDHVRTVTNWPHYVFVANPFADGPAAVYLAARIQRTGGDGAVFGWTSTADDNNSFVSYNGGTTSYQSFGTTARKAFSDGGAFNAAGGATLEIAATTAYWRAWVNGTLAHEVLSNTLPAWQSQPRVAGIVSGESLTGRFYGMVVAAAIPSDAERANVRAYLGGL